MRFVPLGGFLGAGKTTTMLTAGQRLERRGETVAVVTNDQGADLVDTALAGAAGFDRVGEVTGGCFCCRFEDLAEVVTQLHQQAATRVVLAEAVGSCTDLQATVVRPLRRFYGEYLHVAPLTVLVDPFRYRELSALWTDPATEPDLAYLYRHQLAEADIVAVNKADLLGPGEAEQLRADIAARFPHADTVTYSAVTGHGLDGLLDRWAEPAAGGHVPFLVDYDRYGAAEAELAWTNQTLRVLPADGAAFRPGVWVERFARAFAEETERAGTVVGHVKLRAGAPGGTVKASLTAAGGAPSHDERYDGPAAHADVVLNARVQADPAELATLIDRCTAAADAAAGARSGERTGDIFRPGFPVPVHHLPG